MASNEYGRRRICRGGHTMPLPTCAVACLVAVSVSSLAGAAGYDGYPGPNSGGQSPTLAGTPVSVMARGQGAPTMHEAQAGDGYVRETPVDGYGAYEYEPEIPGGVSCGQCGHQFCDGRCPPHAGSGAGIVNRILGEACPRFTAQVDVLMLWRGNVPSRSLFIEEGVDPPIDLLNVNQFGTPVSVGPRVALMLHLDQNYAIEANYFQVQGFDGAGSLPNDATPYEMNSLAGSALGNITDATVLSSAGINSFELNWRRWNSRSITWLAGFRWVEWNEQLNITDNFDDGFQAGQDVIDVATQNDLYGFQLGMDAMLLNLYNTVRFNGIAKAGVYGNLDALATVTAGGDRIVPTETVSLSATPVAFFGELGVNGTVRLSEYWAWRAGYNFFWLSGVATAPPQLNTVNTTGAEPSTIDVAGSVFLHGVNTGIEFVW